MPLPLETLLILLVLAVTLILLVAQVRRVRGQGLQLVASKPFAVLARQAGEAIENGRQVHVGLGRGSLHQGHLPASTAAQEALDALAKRSSIGGIPPQVTLGDATLLPIAQESIQSAYVQANRLAQYPIDSAQFVAPSNAPYAYAVGSGDLIRHGEIGSSAVLGHIGVEMAFMAEAGARANVVQVLGSDDPLGMAIATAYTPHVLLGETMLATGAALHKRPFQIASLLVQNLWRTALILAILVFAILRLLG
ncbi:MAG: hypothetical protein OT477_07640 [Chloroflexi bacterium]|nr:hypothetical protein [Chloroflexota bacterium]